MSQHSFQSTSSVSDIKPNLLISRRCCFYVLLSFLSSLILRWTSFTRALQFTVIIHVGVEVNMLSAYHLHLSICNAAICSAHKIVLIGSNTPVINSEPSVSRAVTWSWIQLVLIFLPRASRLELWNQSLNQIRFFPIFRLYPIFHPILSNFNPIFFRFLDFSRLLDLPIPQL